MATGKLLPLVQAAASGLLDNIVPVQATTPTMRPAPAFANEPQGNPMQGNMPLLPNVFPQQDSNGFEPMKPGGGRFVGEAEDSTPWYKNQNLMDSLALGFNSMRLNPDQGLAGMIQARQKTASELAVGNKTAQAVIAQLRSMGENEAAEMVAAQPGLAKVVMTQLIQRKYAPKASASVSGVETDPDSGQMFVSQFQPDTLEVKRVDIPGAFGETPSQKQQRALSQNSRLENQKISIAQSQAITGKADSLETQLRQYSDAIRQIDLGAESGVIRNMLPSFTSQTAALRSIAQNLGIGVINSATFGALSEKELQLALSTTMDLGLGEAELRQYIVDKSDATAKLYAEMRMKAAQMTTMPYDEFVRQEQARAQANQRYMQAPEGVDKSVWYGLNMEQRMNYRGGGAGSNGGPATAPRAQSATSPSTQSSVRGRADAILNAP